MRGAIYHTIRKAIDHFLKISRHERVIGRKVVLPTGEKDGDCH